MEYPQLRINVQYSNMTFNILNYNYILREIPFVDSHQKFTNNKDIINITCFTNIEFYTFIEVFNCILNKTPLRNTQYFVEYLNRLKYLEYYALLKFFPIIIL